MTELLVSCHLSAVALIEQRHCGKELCWQDFVEDWLSIFFHDRCIESELTSRMTMEAFDELLPARPKPIQLMAVFEVSPFLWLGCKLLSNLVLKIGSVKDRVLKINQH